MRSPALSAVRLIGVACTVDSRFSAVTTISSNSPPLLLAAGAVLAGLAGPAGSGSAMAGPHSSAAPARAAPRSAESTDAGKKAAASAAHHSFFMYESPFNEHIKRPRDPNTCDDTMRRIGPCCDPHSRYWRYYRDPLVIDRLNS